MFSLLGRLRLGRQYCISSQLSKSNHHSFFSKNLSKFWDLNYVEAVASPGIASSTFRFFSTTSIVGRVIWSLKRTPKCLPNMNIPWYLKDGSVRRGQGRSGRNKTGRVVVRHRGGGHPQTYRILDFLRAPLTPEEGHPKIIKKEILQIGYDPCRSGRIALVAGNGSDKLSLILAPDGIKVGDIVSASREKPKSLATIKPGDAYPLKTLPPGIKVHNLEIVPGKGPQLVRAAGTCATLLRKSEVDNSVSVTVKLPSKKEKVFDGNCLAVVGQVSNVDHRNQIIGKAGRSRWLGRRPKGRTGIGRWLHEKKRVGCRKPKL